MLLFIAKTPKRHFLGRKRVLSPHWLQYDARCDRDAERSIQKKIKNKKGSLECTAKIWVFAQTPPVNQSLPNFACGFVSRICFLVLTFEFQKDRVKMWELWGVKISPIPLKRHIAYNYTTACCYRISREDGCILLRMRRNSDYRAFAHNSDDGAVFSGPDFLYEWKISMIRMHFSRFWQFFFAHAQKRR